jgi:hypothetical protein
MTYFLVVCGIVAILGLAAVSAAQDFGLAFFGYAMFAFGVLFGFFLLKRHYDEIDSANH